MQYFLVKNTCYENLIVFLVLSAFKIIQILIHFSSTSNLYNRTCVRAFFKMWNYSAMQKCSRFKITASIPMEAIS